MSNETLVAFCYEYPDGSGADMLIARDPGSLVLGLMPGEALHWRQGLFREVPLLTLRHTCGGIFFLMTLDDIPLTSFPCPLGDGFFVRYTQEHPYEHHDEALA